MAAFNLFQIVGHLDCFQGFTSPNNILEYKSDYFLNDWFLEVLDTILLQQLENIHAGHVKR